MQYPRRNTDTNPWLQTHPDTLCTLTESHSRGAVSTWAKQESPEKCAAAADVPEGHTHLKDNVINM